MGNRSSKAAGGTAPSATHPDGSSLESGKQLGSSGDLQSGSPVSVLQQRSRDSGDEASPPAVSAVLAGVPTGPEKQPTLTPAHPDWDMHKVVDAIDARDEKTPDEWVPRHPDLVRLTGRHPFNCEPTLPDLMSHGFVTPVSLHYVRNHGPAQRIAWESHRITIKGAVSSPKTFTMEDIVSMPSVTIPVTLVCAGNRRKEENMVAKTIGFSWGPAGHSTGYWTGVRFCDVMKLCGIKTPAEGAKHIAFRGPKGELPQGEDGSYGTSLTYAYLMNPANDVLIAYKHNGRYLTPDHGFPVRVIIPGFIGGRMVKYLTEIVAQEEESQNHYHFMDNRVLPPHVTAERAKDEGWWYKPEYIINQLNIQSAISSPAHDEIIPLSQERYTMKGYVFTGGGRKIIRMEVSFNKGETWELATLRQIEKPTEYGRYWCWVFWEFDVETARMQAAEELWCRGWDEAQNTQPEKLTWNLMGMMNNSVFKVKVHPTQGGLTFEQPTQPGNTPGGWMVPKDGSAPPPPGAVGEAPAAPVILPSNGKKFTMEEVQKHDNEESCWFVVNGRVYDSTRYNADHPGGATSILLNAGEDATEEFMSIHSVKAKKILEEYYIGDVDIGAAAPATPAQTDAAPQAAGELVTLNKKKKVSLPLLQKTAISPDTVILRFSLPTPEHRLGLPCGKHFFVYAKDAEGKMVIRAYTPITADNVKGYVELLIKVYRPDANFPQGGQMSQILDALTIGQCIEVKGPIGHFHYLGKGMYKEDGVAGEHKCSRLSMIAGGTGITPMWQVLSQILANPEDKTEIKLLFANRHTEDILLQDELNALAAKHSNLTVWYTLSGRCPDDWTFSKGRMCEEMMAEHIFPAGEETLALMCGPQGMVDLAAKQILPKMGYQESSYVIF